MFYCSISHKNPILENNIKAFIDKFDDHRNLVFYFDANVCINYSDVFLNCQKFLFGAIDCIKDKEKILRGMVDFNSRYVSDGLIVNYKLGLEECCRNPEDFSMYVPLLNQRIGAIDQCLELDNELIFNHMVKKLQINSLWHTKSSKTESKLDSLFSDSVFNENNALALFYFAVLKLFIIDNGSSTSSLSNEEKMSLYLDFLDCEINLYTPSLFLLAINWWGGGAQNNSEFKKRFYSKMVKGTIEKRLHGAFNCAIDLIYPPIISLAGHKIGCTPVFVTDDQILAKRFFDCLSVQCYFVNQSGTLPFVAMEWFENKFSSKFCDSLKERLLKRSIDVYLNNSHAGVDSASVTRLCHLLEEQFKSI